MTKSEGNVGDRFPLVFPFQGPMSTIVPGRMAKLIKLVGQSRVGMGHLKVQPRYLLSIPKNNISPPLGCHREAT